MTDTTGASVRHYCGICTCATDLGMGRCPCCHALPCRVTDPDAPLLVRLDMPRVCRVCGGESEHDFAVHVEALRAGEHEG